jgi:hypothetical protein
LLYDQLGILIHDAASTVMADNVLECIMARNCIKIQLLHQNLKIALKTITYGMTARAIDY